MTTAEETGLKWVWCYFIYILCINCFKDCIHAVCANYETLKNRCCNSKQEGLQCIAQQGNLLSRDCCSWSTYWWVCVCL